MTLQIEAGKYYRTRDGRKVGPMVCVIGPDYGFDTDDRQEGGFRWYNDGRTCSAHKTPRDIIAEWRDDHATADAASAANSATVSTPAHIITHEGRIYDLTALETPFGLLPPPVQRALREWPHGLEIYNCDATGKRGAWFDMPVKVWDWHTVRAKPAPDEVRVTCRRYGLPSNFPFETGTCIVGPDGKPDWTTWEPLP